MSLLTECGYLCVPAKLGERYDAEDVVMIEILPRYGGTYFEIAYTLKKDVPVVNDDPTVEVEGGLDSMASLDPGVTKLATVYFSKEGVRPLTIDARSLGFLNLKTRRQTARNNRGGGKSGRNENKRIYKRRKNRMTNALHTAAANITTALVKHGVKRLIAGYNRGWKQGCNMGKRNNHKFVMIAHRRFYNILHDKLTAQGIEMYEQEESFTSRCDALAFESIERHQNYAGRRVRRGLFRSSIKDKNGEPIRIHSDVNGAINIMRKFLDIHTPKSKITKLNADLKERLHRSARLLKSPYGIRVDGRRSHLDAGRLTQK